MSKQICFFATQRDIALLTGYIFTLDARIIDYVGNDLTKEVLYASFDNAFQEKNFLITKSNFLLSYRTTDGKREIDPYTSEVIEMSTCRPISPKIIDISSVEKEFEKGGFVVIDDSEKYHLLMKKLMLNPPYIKNPNYVKNGFECGRFWYAPKFWNSTGESKKKNEALDNLFKSLTKYIKKSFILSKDKFAYIAPDAYEKYLMGSFVPCSGKTRILF